MNYQTMKTNRNQLKYPTLYIEIFFLTLDQELEAAEELLNKILRTDPANSEALLCWCETRMQRGHREAVASFAQELVRRDPNNPYYLLALAVTYTKPDHTLAEAKKVLEDAYDAAAGSYDALAKVGFISCVSGFWNLGLQAFLASAEMAPEDEDRPYWLPETSEAIASIPEETKQNLDGFTDTPGLSRTPVAIATRVCFFLAACRDLGVPEAWVAGCVLWSLHGELKHLDDDALIQLFGVHCLHTWTDVTNLPSLELLLCPNQFIA